MAVLIGHIEESAVGGEKSFTPRILCIAGVRWWDDKGFAELSDIHMLYYGGNTAIQSWGLKPFAWAYG